MKKVISLALVLGMLLCGCSASQGNQTSSKTEISVQSEVSEESEVSKEESKLPEPESRDVFAMDTYMVLKDYGSNAQKHSGSLQESDTFVKSSEASAKRS